MKPYLEALPKPARIAHRGGALLAPENTLPAFSRAVEIGVDGLELDVHLTRDAEVVVLHDDDVERTTDGKGKVCAMSLSEVRALDAGHRFTVDGVSFPYRGKGTKVPTLREVLTAFPRVPMNIELKSPEEELVARFSDLIREFGAESSICVGSGRSDVAERVRLALPASCTFFPEQTARELIFVVKASDEPPVRIWPWDLLALPLEAEGMTLVDRPFVEAVHGMGLHLHVWTLNDAEAIRVAMALGVDGIMTDDPQLLRRVIQAP